MHSLCMQIASLSNIAGKTKWLINHGFPFFPVFKTSVQEQGIQEKILRKLYVCTYVPETWFSMCSLAERICLGQIEPAVKFQALCGH